MRTSYLFLLLLCIAMPLKAQIKFRTGNVELDTDLNRINVRASADFGKFKAELGTTYNISEQRIEHFHTELRMEPAEIYYALEIASVTNRPVDDVIEVYRIHKTHGWGQIAKQLGIKPGSAEFHQLKGKVKNKSKKGNDKGSGKNKEKSKHDHGNGKNK